MKELICNSVFFGVAVSIFAYQIGVVLQKRLKTSLCNPLLIAVILIIVILLIFEIDYKSYYEGAKYLSYLLTPATVALAIPLHEQMENLKKNSAAIMAGIISGILSSMLSVLALAFIFKLTKEHYVTLLPKSVTTAIGMGISEELGGIVTITVASIIITGIIGNVFADLILKYTRITHPVAKGIAIGSSAHAIGTVKAMEMGKIEGAMSSLSIAVSGVITVGAASIFAKFY